MAKGKVENLIPQNKRTKDEQRQIARIGGIASGESRRKTKNIIELLELYLSQKAKDDDLTNEELIVITLADKAKKGDMKAMQIIFDYLAVKKQKVDVTSSDGSMSPKDFTIHFIKPDNADGNGADK